MNTHESYVSLETAKLLKEARFDWEICSLYNEQDEFICSQYKDWNKVTTCKSAPTLSIAQKWLREVKEYHICVNFLFANNHRYYVFLSSPSETGPLECNCGWIEEDFNTYEQAQETGIKKALEIILKERE